MVTWFLLGGDLYTAYTFIAVPAVLFGAGASGFFAVPYTILVYPIVFVIMPKLWHAAHKAGHVTAADVVFGRYKSRPLEFAIALTGVAVTDFKQGAGRVNGDEERGACDEFFVI